MPKLPPAIGVENALSTLLPLEAKLAPKVILGNQLFCMALASLNALFKRYWLPFTSGRLAIVETGTFKLTLVVFTSKICGN